MRRRWRREEGETSVSINSTSLAWHLAVRSRSSPTCSFYLSCARRHSVYTSAALHADAVV
eukprot:1524761-Pyramimonas_sp.AAC.1